MKAGQACTYIDADGREFSALIERVIKVGVKNPVVNVVYKQLGKDRRAELVPEKRIRNLHDIKDELVKKIAEEDEAVLEESNTVEEDEESSDAVASMDEDNDSNSDRQHTTLYNL